MALCHHYIELEDFEQWKERVQHKNYVSQPGERHQGQPSGLFRCVSAIAGAHHHEHGELFMPALTREPISGVPCHTGPHSNQECG